MNGTIVPSHEQVLKRGRVTVISIVALVALSEVSIAVATIAWFDWRHFWQLAECERALLGLAKDPDESIRYYAVSAICYGQLVRRETKLAIEVMRKIRALPLPNGRSC